MACAILSAAKRVIGLLFRFAVQSDPSQTDAYEFSEWAREIQASDRLGVINGFAAFQVVRHVKGFSEVNAFRIERDHKTFFGPDQALDRWKVLTFHWF
jgi:hypothetical protein